MKLSEQLAELSRRARSVEDAYAQAEKEARDKIEARKKQAVVAAQSAVEKTECPSCARSRL